MPEQSQRAWQRERTQEALRIAAVDLFEVHGYDAVTVAQIAERAGVTSRTFFRYFPAKDEVLFDLSASTDPSVVAEILGAPAELGPAEAVAYAMRAVMAGLPMDLNAFGRGLRVAMTTPSLRGRFSEILLASESLLEETLAARTGAPDEARLAAAAIMAVEKQVLFRWADAGGSGDLVGMLERGLAALGRGFHRPSKG